nr:MAG TPA: hypothetical protein [Caudoviricetes sp.]
MVKLTISTVIERITAGKICVLLRLLRMLEIRANAKITHPGAEVLQEMVRDG